jgi:hypothetical protein
MKKHFNLPYRFHINQNQLFSFITSFSTFASERKRRGQTGTGQLGAKPNLNVIFSIEKQINRIKTKQV